MLDLNAEAPIDEILTLDTRRRELLTEVEALRAERNTVSKEIGRSKDQEARQAKIEQMRVVGDRIKDLETELKDVESALYEAMLQVPNLPGPGRTRRPGRGTQRRSSGRRASPASSTLSRCPIGTWDRRWTSSTLSAGSSSRARASTC